MAKATTVENTPDISQKVLVKYVQFYTPFIMAGVNFKEKVDATTQPIIMYLCRKWGELHVYFKNEFMIMPPSSFRLWSPANPEDADIDVKLMKETKPLQKQTKAPPALTGTIRAQVSSPAGFNK